MQRFFSTTCARFAKQTPQKGHYAVTPLPDNLPRGFIVTGLHAGVKKTPGVLDLALIVSKQAQTAAAACFTRNAFQAAPVLVCKDVLEQGSGRARAVIVNSGCANAVTGKQGLSDAWKMAAAADTLADRVQHVTSKSNNPSSFVMSTGVIGQNLPISKIISAATGIKVDELGDTPAHWELAARAFMTTDTFPKLRARKFQLSGKDVRIAGIDKGAGMIHPNMGPPSPIQPLHATLLAFVATDAAISPPLLQQALTYAVDRSFNSISVDGDMSTNDTILALANGASGMAEITSANSNEFTTFQQELNNFTAELAQLVVRDGEGATKFVTVDVQVRL
jgi:glutamate N-acetyltransferase / amino-acid N-acetyltransferase